MLTAPLSAAPRYTKTRPDSSPHDLRTAKHFIGFVALGTVGMDDEEGRAKVSTIRESWRCFVSAWARRNEKSISADVKGSILNVWHHMARFPSASLVLLPPLAR